MNKPDFSTYIIKDKDFLKRLKNYVSTLNPEYCVIDVETDSEQEKLANLYGFGLCFSEHKAFYVPWRDNKGNKYWSEPEENDIKNWLKNTLSNTKVVNHNIIYDFLVLENNFNWPDMSEYIYSDTILQKHTLEEEPPFALKEIAVKELGKWADKAQDELSENVAANGGKWLKKQKDMYLADTEVLGEYCCWDVMITYLLFNKYEKRLKEEGLYDLFYKDEVMPLYKEVTIGMKRKGFPVDVEYFKKLRKEIIEDIYKLEDSIIESIKDETKDFEKSILDKNNPVSRSGNFPRVLAEELDIPLPLLKKKNKDTGEVTYNPTLGKAAIEKQLKSATDKDHIEFYNWILEDTKDFPFSEEIANKVQKKLFFNVAANKNKRYIFNLGSTDHLIELIINIWNIDPLEYTDTGKPKVDIDFLNHLSTNIMPENEVVRNIVDFKKLNKLLSTYIDGILDRQIDGVIYTSMKQFGTTSGRYSSSNPNCLSLDTEILTKYGWKKYNEIKKGDKVAAFNGDEIELQPVENYYLSDNSYKNIISVKNTHFDMRLTENHRVIAFDRKNNDNLIEKKASDFPKDAKIYHGKFTNTKNIGINKDWIKFLIACQADAEISGRSPNIRFCFEKKRKYERLINILDRLSFDYTDKSDINKKIRRYQVIVHNKKELVLDYIGYGKVFPSDWTFLGAKERKVFLEEIFHWDGSYTRKTNYSSNCEKNVDLVQALCSLEGWRAHKRTYRSLRSKEDNYQLDITRRNYSLTANVKISEEKSNEKVWCVSVPSGMILVRRGSDTFISGNCQNLPRIKDEESGLSELVLSYTNAIRKGFIAGRGRKVVNADFSSLEPICFAHMSDDERLRSVYKEGKDLYSQVAIDVFNIKGVSAYKKDSNYLKNVNPEFRQRSKIFSLAVPYGSGASRISQEMKVSYKEANKIIRSYLNAYPNLKKYMFGCNYEARNKGEVSTIFGRVRHLPEAKRLYKKYGKDLLDYKWAEKNNLTKERRKYKNLLNNAKNFKIQGLAAHIVNRAMIQVAREFKKNNIDGWVALQVHDEITCVVAEDQAKKASEILQESMENTTKISIPLQAEPIIADNWGEAK